MRRCLLLTAILAFLALALGLERSPTSWPDSQLYAAIARSRQLYGVGIPSSLLNSPYATDHTRFYGPVFFDLAAWSFDAFGVSKWSFRLVSLGGALLLVVAGGVLGRQLSGSAGGWLWPLALLALTPEVGLHARTGSMDTLAIGLELTALAVFVRGLALERHARWHGAAAGLVLALAALTTPRTYPFIAAFTLAGVLPFGLGLSRRQRVEQLLPALVVCASIVGVWAAGAHGNPLRWLRFVAYIARHEDTDVAILATATRNWSFSVANSITAAFTIAGAIPACWALSKRGVVPASSRDRAAAFALLTTTGTLVACVVLMNLTFTLSTYCALPLFAVIAGLPRQYFAVGRPRLDRRLAACAVAALLVCDVTVAGVRAVRVASTWAARDTDSLEAFLQAHVPSAADVIGPFDAYFFAVEQAGAHFWVVSPQSWADWARWVPRIDPAGVGPLPRARAGSSRFLIWQAERELPARYACARSHLIGTYTPAPTHWFANPILPQGADTGYWLTDLYQLPDDCPDGYDPTRLAIPYNADVD
jgi:hypothetical protein